MKRKILVLLVIALLYNACAIIDFGNDEVTCTPDSSLDYYNHEYVKVSFNCTVNHFSAEQCLKIQVNNQALPLLFQWDENTLYAKPEVGWINGRCYSFSMNGSVRKNNGSQFSVNNKCTFIYGDKNNSFVLLNKPSVDKRLLSSDSITFSFNHEVNYVDFSKALIITPSEKIKYSFNDDNKSISVIPESGWTINTIYKWEIKDLISKDNWELAGITEGNFITQNDIENPCLLKICPVSDASESSIWFENTDLDRNISKLECIGFVFSKPMDFSSIKSGISISPSISGYFYQTNSEGKKYIFVPLTEYEIDTKYLITISPSVKDQVGNNLFEEIKKEFYSGDSFLKITMLNIGNVDYSIIPDELVASTTFVDGNETLPVIISFSAPIENNARYTVNNNISLNLQFPMTSTAPVLLSTKWDVSNTILTITWGNITKSTSEANTYYDLKFNGGKTGISTGNGNYMEDNICIHIKISS